ncbi:MAG: mandelate racemase/muconate lactonizing enzyme family protein [Candidatus Dormibacteria bacterium]
MRIRSVSTAVIEANYDWTLVRVSTDEGVSGLGECFTSPGLTALIREIGSLLVGENPANVEPLLRLMRNATAHAASGGGAVHHAITGIESALWELNARALDVPLYQLFGGAFRSSVRIYADCHAGDALHSYSAVLQERVPAWMAGSPAAAAELGVHWDTRDEAGVYTPEAYAQRAKQMAERGFSALKFDLDLPRLEGEDLHARTISQRQLERQVSLARAAVEAVGPDVGVAFDCHWRYAASDALRLARALEDVPILWLEDPVPPENVAALASVTARTSTPILTGENTYLATGFQQLIDAGAVDIVAPDIQKAGGLAEARRIAELADRHYIPVAPHNISGPVGTLASAHLCAATPNFLALEWHAASVPFFDDLLAGGSPLIREGQIHLDASAPGLGRELDVNVCQRYARRDEPFFD